MLVYFSRPTDPLPLAGPAVPYTPGPNSSPTTNNPSPPGTADLASGAPVRSDGGKDHSSGLILLSRESSLGLAQSDHGSSSGATLAPQSPKFIQASFTLAATSKHHVL